MTQLRQTPLHPLHQARGARLVPFAGWTLPVQFQGLMVEHAAVRTRAGLFDVSHMGQVTVVGRDAAAALQATLSNDLERIADGQALYTVMCTASGGIVDDLIVHRQSPTAFFICLNAARRDADLEHLRRTTASFDCTVTDVSDDYALLALQGPQALGIAQNLTTLPVATMPPFSWGDAEVAGVADVRVARTGYTGEEGVELYCPADHAVRLWEGIESAGADAGLQLCGLGARDTLRLEARLMLYGNDIDLTTNPFEAGLGWTVKLDKGDFVGRAALAEVKANKPARKLVGFEVTGRGVARAGYPLQVQGETVGQVTSGTHSPTLGKALGLGYVPREHARVGTALEVEIRGKPVAATVVKTPFYKREAS